MTTVTKENGKIIYIVYKKGTEETKKTEETVDSVETEETVKIVKTLDTIRLRGGDCETKETVRLRRH